MATILVPVVDTEISVSAFGAPVANQLNTNTTDLAALKQTAWVSLTLQNGWVNSGGNRPPSRYCKTGSLVMVQLACMSGTSGFPIATLPAGYRPPYQYETLVRAGGSPPNAIAQVTSDGTVTAFYPTGATTDICAGLLIVPLT